MSFGINNVEMCKSALSQIVIGYRRQQALSLRQFAAAVTAASGVRVSHQAIANWERGAIPSAEVVAKLSLSSVAWCRNMGCELLTELLPEITVATRTQFDERQYDNNQ